MLRSLDDCVNVCVRERGADRHTDGQTREREREQGGREEEKRGFQISIKTYPAKANKVNKPRVDEK